MKSTSCWIVFFCLLAPLGWSGSEATKEKRQRVYETARANGQVPVIDGSLDDPAWQTVSWSSEFIQREPADGIPPTRQTSFKVIYDDDALYFAFRMEDNPEKVSSLMDRRDRFPGDWVEVNIDSYGDRRTAFSFTLSLSGTRGDEFISNDGNNWDSNWDPIWHGATRVDGEGWTAESRIPLSQLRFSGEQEQTWGLQVQRRIFRLDERSTWQPIPKDSSGWVSKFGELRGLRNLKPKRRIELLPYAVAGGRRAASANGDPFFDGSEGIFDGGLDGKYGLTNNLTLDFTINPDFGQVEADPSEVNLTSFESFFDEKRPFFIEGRNIFELPLAPAVTGGDFTRDRLFYSRRIGRPPGFSPHGEHVDQPDRTSILGAFKLTGKTRNGLSIGILESVTERESAAIAGGDQITRQTVEPFTNYFVGRVQKDFHDGDTQVGTILTAVNRNIDEPQLDFMVDEAYAGGVDFTTYFHDRGYRLDANFLGSKLRGSEQAIGAVQTSSARYFQRPDNESADYDPTRTSLDGNAGSVRFRRTSNYNLVFETGVTYRSPGFEINDLGFMRNADQVNQFLWVAYQKRNPFSIFDRMEINGNQWADWDTSGNWLGARFNVNGNTTFRSRYHMNAGITRTNEFRSQTQLRGGPASLWPGNTLYNIGFGSDSRKSLSVSSGGSLRQGDEASARFTEVWAEVLYRPTNAISLLLNPWTNRNQPEMQYVNTLPSGGEDRFLFGRLDQKTTALTIRLDWAITPNLTCQLYGAPFISTGRFTEFKRIVDPMANDYRSRFETFQTTRTARQADQYLVDENGDGTTDYQFRDPDFDVREFNSNLVIRWEYQPGSTFFLVWSQARANYNRTDMDQSVSEDLDQLFTSHPENVLLLKVSKWFTP